MAKTSAGEPRGVVWLMDRRPYWRRLYERALAKAGFAVCARSTYRYPPAGLPLSATNPDLVLMVCTVVGPEERRLIDQVTARDHRLLVLAANLPTEVMREIFLAGAHDVNQMPARPEEVVRLVEDVLEEVAEVRGRPALLLAGV